VNIVWTGEELDVLYTVSKKQAKLFSSEFRQICTKFNNFWYKDGQDDRFM